MKLLLIALFGACLGLATPAFASDAGKVEAEKLLAVLDLQATMDQAMALELESQLRNNPALLPYKDIILTFMRKYMSYESLKPELVELYAGEFTAAELKEARQFYSTTTGRKFIASMPRLMTLGASLGSAQVQQHMGELDRMIKDETARIQAAQPGAKQ